MLKIESLDRTNEGGSKNSPNRSDTKCENFTANEEIDVVDYCRRSSWTVNSTLECPFHRERYFAVFTLNSAQMPIHILCQCSASRRPPTMFICGSVGKVNKTIWSFLSSALFLKKSFFNISSSHVGN